MTSIQAKSQKEDLPGLWSYLPQLQVHQSYFQHPQKSEVHQLSIPTKSKATSRYETPNPQFIHIQNNLAAEKVATLIHNCNMMLSWERKLLDLQTLQTCGRRISNGFENPSGQRPRRRRILQNSQFIHPWFRFCHIKHSITNS